ncbi:MAG: hypothetical protein JJU12_08350 [Chlamydiales bacterium]|nr:hypothetical protein [Chlamydiales bacterium]
MAQPAHAQFNPGCCFSIKHSEAYHNLKEGTLLITTAIATIAVVGGVLAVLSMNGVNLGPLNSITSSLTSLVGEKYIHIGLAAGTGLLLIDTVLISSLTRSYYNKQFTQKEINQEDLSKWVNSEDVLSKLEPRSYWKFPAIAEKPQLATPDNPEVPAVWGCVVKNEDGSIGFYAYKTQEDLHAQLKKLGYEDGEARFNQSNQYTLSYLRTKVDRIKLNEIENTSPIASGHYRLFDPLKITEGTSAYPCKINRGVEKGGSQIFYSKTPEFRERITTGLIDHNEVRRKFEELEEKPEYLPKGSSWALDNAITVTKNGAEVKLFILYIHPLGELPRPICFDTLDEAQKFARDQGLKDAKAELKEEKTWPDEYVEDQFDLTELKEKPLEDKQLTTLDFTNPSVYALKYRDSQTHYRYFKTEDARNEYIQNWLAEYWDPKVVEDFFRATIRLNQLEKILTELYSCYTAQLKMRVVTWHILIGRSPRGLQCRPFKSLLELSAYKGSTWNDVGKPVSSGQFNSEWINANQNKMLLLPAQQAASELKANEHNYGVIETENGLQLFWLAFKKDNEEPQLLYFASGEARESAIDKLRDSNNYTATN